MKMYKWNVEEFCGYTPKTTFWEDFRIADNFGVAAIKDTFKRAFDEWKNNIIYVTELVMVLNHSIWLWHEKNDEYAELYHNLWEATDLFVYENYSGDDLRYFLGVTD